jgi:hypothetical protein
MDFNLKSIFVGIHPLSLLAKLTNLSKFQLNFIDSGWASMTLISVAFVSHTSVGIQKRWIWIWSPSKNIIIKSNFSRFLWFCFYRTKSEMLKRFSIFYRQFLNKMLLGGIRKKVDFNFKEDYDVFFPACHALE